jgi:hypothetical protein
MKVEKDDADLDILKQHEKYEWDFMQKTPTPLRKLDELGPRVKASSIGSPVAVKCYKSWVLEEPGQYERIIRELESGRRIQHPNLVKTLSIIKDPDGKPARL